MIADVSFAERLKRYRLAAGITQEELANLAHMSVRTISNLERGVNRVPQYETLHLLADALRLADAERQTFMEVNRLRRAPEPAAPSTHASLPWPLTPLFGRADEIAEVSALLTRDDIRALTLTGPPGIGKTRLAVQVARNLAGTFTHGTAYFALASLRDPALVLETIAHGLGIRPAGTVPVLEILATHLRERSCLLVLDNLEQIVDAAPALADLLSRCPQIHLLMTSRVALNIRGEHRFIVPPLEVPATSVVSAETLCAFPATALFLEQARAAMPDYVPTAADASAIAAICSRLDGIPLAIELTAARIGLLPPSALLQRLDRRLSLLNHGPRDLPLQQRTLREALDWSYDLLSAREQRIFRQLAVFAGEWNLESAVHICDLPEHTLFEAIKTLIDSSLVQPVLGDDHEDSRFMLLETIRAYGLERLREQGEEFLLGRRHAIYYAAYAEQCEPALQGPQAGTRLAEMTRSHDNLRAALAWAEAQNDVTLGIRLAAPLWRFWYLSRTLREGQHWFGVFLERTHVDDISREWRIRALHGASIIALELNLWDHARSLALDCLNEAEAADDQLHMQHMWNVLGNLAKYQGDLRAAEHAYRRALDLARQRHDDPAAAVALNNLGVTLSIRGEHQCAEEMLWESLRRKQRLGAAIGSTLTFLNMSDLAQRRGDITQAAAFAQRALDEAQRLNAPILLAGTYNNVGEVARAQGDLVAAAEMLARSLAIFETHDDTAGTIMAARNLGHVARLQGDWQQAQGYYHRALALSRQSGLIIEGILCLEGWALLLNATAIPHLATEFLGTTIALREQRGIPLHAIERQQVEPALQAMRKLMGDDTFDYHWQCGRARTLFQALAMI